MESVRDLFSFTLERGGDSLAKGEHPSGGEVGESAGGVTGALTGEVSGEASVENGDCLRRMERSSKGLEEGGGLRVRVLPLRAKVGGGDGEGRCKREGGGDAAINSITSISKEGSKSSTGLTGSSSTSASDCSLCTPPSSCSCI